MQHGKGTWYWPLYGAGPAEQIVIDSFKLCMVESVQALYSYLCAYKR